MIMVLFLKIDCWGRLIGKKPIVIKLFDLCFWHWKTRSKCVKYFWNTLKLVRFIKPQTPKRKFNVNTNLDDWRSILFLLDFSSTSSFFNLCRAPGGLFYLKHSIKLSGEHSWFLCHWGCPWKLWSFLLCPHPCPVGFICGKLFVGGKSEKL